MTEPATDAAKESLDGYVEDGGYLFAWGSGSEYVARTGGGAGRLDARVFGDIHSGWYASGAGVDAGGRHWPGDRPLTDEELQDFLDAFGFKPAEPELPSTDYIHVDSIRQASETLSDEDLWTRKGQASRMVTTARAFEALRRAEL